MSDLSAIIGNEFPERTQSRQFQLDTKSVSNISSFLGNPIISLTGIYYIR